jgi:hypothetical protein
MTDMARNGLTYAEAGVDIDAGNRLVELIKPMVRGAARPGAEAEIGGFDGRPVRLQAHRLGADAAKPTKAADQGWGGSPVAHRGDANDPEAGIAPLNDRVPRQRSGANSRICSA